MNAKISYVLNSGGIGAGVFCKCSVSFVRDHENHDRRNQGAYLVQQVCEEQPKCAWLLN